jgi:DNA-binding CsgD family transcriptional regulator
VYEEGSPLTSRPPPAPRQRVTMNLLLQGETRTQIAAHLGISPHTAQGYIKAVLRHFGVHSRPELLARFHRGDGGDGRA